MRLRKDVSGFTLFEILLVACLITFGMMIKAQADKREADYKFASMLGQEAKQAGEALDAYLTKKFPLMTSLTNSPGSVSDPGPRVCNVAADTCTITTQTLINEGLLPPGFGVNSFVGGYTYRIKRVLNAGEYNLDGLAVSVNALNYEGAVRQDLLGAAVREIGVDGGRTFNSTIRMDGDGGLWNATAVDFDNINTIGQLGVRKGYSASVQQTFLRRDGTLPMTGNLNMGNLAVSNVSNVTLNPTLPTTAPGTVCPANGQISSDANGLLLSCVSGQWATQGSRYWRDPVATYALLPVVSNNIGDVRETLDTSRIFTWNGVAWIAIAVDQNGNLVVSNTLTANTIVATTQITTGKAQINDIVTLGTACSPDGLVARNAVGLLLSCQSGTWKNATSAGNIIDKTQMAAFYGGRYARFNDAIPRATAAFAFGGGVYGMGPPVQGSYLGYGNAPADCTYYNTHTCFLYVTPAGALYTYSYHKASGLLDYTTYLCADIGNCVYLYGYDNYGPMQSYITLTPSGIHAGLMAIWWSVSQNATWCPDTTPMPSPTMPSC